MRIDEASPRTWLLAVVAGWAALAWVLTVAGMGGRVAPLEAEPGLLERLPPMHDASVARPGPLVEYDAIAARPLFSPDRTPQPFFLEGLDGEDGTQGFDYVLTSVLLTPQIQLAILQPPDGSLSFRVRLNQGPTPHPAWHLIELDERSAVFDGPQGRRTLQLRVFDGVGGRPSSILGGADAAGAERRRVPATPTSRGAGDAGDPVADEPKRAARDTPSETTSTDESGQGGPETVADATQPTTDAAQIDAIRQRIQARREAMRNPPTPEPPANNR